MPSPAERAGRLALLLALAAPPAQAAGTVLERAPTVAPGLVPQRQPEPLALARQRWVEGDVAGTVTALTPWLSSRRGPYGRERSAGHLLLGLAHKSLGNWNLASTHFYLVRRTDDPLAPWGAWYEAVVDHERGRHQVAINECTAYRERFPEGLHADECLVLMGEAHAALGRRSSAISEFEEWLELHPDSPRTEEIELAKARAVAASRPQAGVAMLQELVLTHTFPSTAVGARQALAELAEQGFDTTLPTDLRSRQRLAHSLRRSGKLEEAWELFEQLQDEAEAVDADGQPLQPQLQAWVDDNEDRFAWGTRQFDVYAAKLVPRFEAEPSRRLGWRIFRAYARGGMWQEASEWGAKLLESWGGRDSKEAVAWAFLHAGRYPQARERFDELGRTGGSLGRDARFYAAFSALRDGQLDIAVDELGVIAERGGDWAAAAAYWRARAHAGRGEYPESRQWERKAIELDETGWYRMLIEDRMWRAAGAPQPPRNPDTATESDRWLLRDGSWHGHQPPALVLREDLPRQPARASTAGTAQGPLPSHEDGLLTPATSQGWQSLRWQGRLVADTDAPPAQGALPSSAHIELPIGEEARPDGYGACTWYDPDSAAKNFEKISESYADLLPDLPAAYDLALAGQAVDAGRILRDAWEQWERAEGRSDEASQRLRRIRIADWRDLALFARQPHLTYRLCFGLWKHATDDESELAAWRLAYPLVRTPELWHHGRSYGVDPFLMMGIMRQESTYQATVVSHAGAIGLVQVMPRTGAKVAALLGEGRYSPRDLEDPATNLRYGTYYMSLLLKRFDGAFPLAVASYNGGPHNISRWLRTFRDRDERIDLAAFVEQIEYSESRNYVKKVSGYYDTYVRLYGPRGAQVVLPTHPTGDDPSVVDF